MAQTHWHASHWIGPATGVTGGEPGGVSGYTVDYSGDHALMEGVETATYLDPDGASDSAVKVKRGNLTMSDIQGATFAVHVTDVPFFVWLATLVNAELVPGGKLTVNSILYIVVGILWSRADGSQARIITRKGRA